MSISILYTRVSSVDQKTDRQRVKENEFDKVNGINDKMNSSFFIIYGFGGKFKSVAYFYV